MKKRAGRPFNANKMKRAGRPFNAMKRKRRPILLKGPSKRKPMTRSKKEDEIYEYDDEKDDYVDEDEDLSKYWSDYDTFGYDKRGLGSMKRGISTIDFRPKFDYKRAGRPFNANLSNNKFMK